MKKTKPKLGLKYFHIILFLWSGFYLTAQPQPCTSGNENTCKCNTAPHLCTADEFDGFTFSMTSFMHPSDGPYLQGPGQECLCPGYCSHTSENPTWVKFTAWCEAISFNICWANCTMGSCSSRGVQAAVYSECFGCGEAVCLGNSWEENSYSPSPYTFAQVCQTDGCGTNNGCRTMNLNNLTIGKTYYILVDGCCGSACDITFEVNTFCPFPGFGDFQSPITGPDTICPNQLVTFESGVCTAANGYAWYVNDVFVDFDRTEPIQLNYQFSQLGSYEICVKAFHEPCIPADSSNRIQCFLIQVTCGGINPTETNIANIAINNDASSPHASAMLHVKSNNKGILIPRMTKSQRDSILLPAYGLLIFQTDELPGFYFNANTEIQPNWLSINDCSSIWKQYQNNIYRIDGKVGIGVGQPKGKLHIVESTDWTGIQFVGVGSNDMSVDYIGFTEADSLHFIIQINNGASQPNEIIISYDNGNTWSSSIPIINPIDLGYGVTGSFVEDIGHVVGDQWSFTVYPDYGESIIVKEGKIGVGTSQPNQNAVLDVFSQEKGFLPPRLTTSQRDAIQNPPRGLMIYNVDINCMEWFNGGGWFNPCN